MKKLQIIIIVFLISFSICAYASMQTKASNTYTYTASISPASTYAGLTGVSYTITFTDTCSNNMGSGTINIPTGYTAVSLTSVTASNGDPWSGSVASSTISFNASQSDDEISNGQTVTVVFSATNPSSAHSYTWTTAAYSDTSEGGTAFTIGGSQPSVTVNAGAATYLVVTSSSGVQTAGVPFTILVTAEDAYGNTAVSYRGTVVFTTSDFGPHVSLPGPYTFTAAAAGAASFSVILMTAGSQSITATDTSNSSIAGCLDVTVDANVATQLVVTSSSGVQTAGVPFTILVRALNAYGNTAVSYRGTVVFTTSDFGPHVSLPGPYTFTAAAAGAASFSVILMTAGSQSITATDTSNSSIAGCLDVTVDANVATQLVVTSSSGVQTAGVPFTILVRALNAYGNTAVSYRGTVVFTTSDFGSHVSLPGPYTFTAAAAGAASFSVILVTAGSQWINVTDTVNSSINGSLALMVTHACVAVSVTVLPASATITAGGSQAFTATDKDAYGNTWDVTSTVNWSIDSGADGSVSALGVATATKVGIWTVSALDGSGNLGIASLTVDQGVATHFVVSGFPSPTAAGVSGTVTVTAYDAYGNVATGYTGTVQFASSDGQAVLPADSTLSSGTGTFSVTLKTAGTQSITATDSVDSSITGSQTGITIDSNVAVSLVVSSGTSQTAGLPFDVTVTAYDAYGNIATGYLGTVTFTSSDLGAGVVLPSAYTFTSGDAGSHVFSVTLVTATTTAWVSATDGVLTGTQSSITVDPAAASTFSISAVSSPQTVGVGFSVTITAEDVYGNTATSYVGTPSLSDISGTISPTVTSAFVGGVWSGTVTVTLAGSDSITAADGAITGTSNTFTVTHASAVSIAVSPATDSITAGNSVTYTATATDAYGNSWDVTGLVIWSIDSGAGGSWSGATYTSANAGSWTVKATLGEVYGTASLTVNIYQITVISAHGNPTASASVNEGGSFTASVTSPESAGVGQQWICTGYSIDGGSVVSGTSYTFQDIQLNHTITFNWQEQYYLTTSTNFGSAGPASGWYDAGSTVTLSATAPSAGLGEQYAWNGWTGTGTGSYSGNNNPATNTVTMNGPITETASWTHQYELTVTSAYGSTSGQGWYNAGVSVPFSVNTPVSGGTGVQYVLTSWSGSGTGAYSGSSSSSSVTMNNPITETANWQTQYQVTFAVNGGGLTIPTGSNVWENAGSLHITATPNTGYTFSFWSSNTGSITFNNDNSASATATISGTGTITATFAITTSPTPIVSSPSSTPIVSSPSPTPIVSSPSPTPIVSSSSPTPKGSSPSPTPLYVVLVAVIIVAAIILISIGIALKRSRRKTNIALSN